MLRFRLITWGTVFLIQAAMANAQLHLTPVPTPLPPDGKPIRALYVFVPNILDSQSSAQELLDFCSARGVNRIFLNPDVYLRTRKQIPDDANRLATFIGAAHDSGILVYALYGDPGFVPGLNMTSFNPSAPPPTTSNNGGLLRLQDVFDYNGAAGIEANQRFDGIIYDVEPWMTAPWADDSSPFTTRIQIGSRFVEFYDTARDLIDDFEGAHPGQTLALYAVSSFFLDGPQGTTVTYNSISQSIVEHLIELTDLVNVLSFRNFATGANSITAIGEQEVRFAAERGKTLSLAVETNEIDPPHITFYGMPVDALEGALVEVRDYFAGKSPADDIAYLGSAIQDYPGYRALVEATAPTPTPTPTPGSSLVIFDWDTRFPDSAGNFGYFYLQPPAPGGRSGQGLPIEAPAQTRSFGGGFDLNLATGIDLTAYEVLYGWIRTDNPATHFTVAFELENGGTLFIPDGHSYTTEAAIPFSGTDFTKVQFYFSNFVQYGGSNFLIPNNITQMTWIFPDNTTGISGPDQFMLDDVTAASLYSVADWSLY